MLTFASLRGGINGKGVMGGAKKKKRTRKGENYSFLPSPSPSPLGALRGLQVKLDKSLNFEVLVKIMKRYD